MMIIIIIIIIIFKKKIKKIMTIMMGAFTSIFPNQFKALQGHTGVDMAQHKNCIH